MNTDKATAAAGPKFRAVHVEGIQSVVEMEVYPGCGWTPIATAENPTIADAIVEGLLLRNERSER